MPSLRPVFGCWHPTWTAIAIFQNYKTPTADGSILTLNHPYLGLTWNNDIELPHAWRLNAMVQWTSRGDYDNFRINKSRFYSGIGVQKDISLQHLGSLTVDARCMDIFNTSKAGATIFGPRELYTSNPARRTFLLDLTWKFNSAGSKYRGTGAGEKQKARM
jgi:hypothetical protein